MNFGCCDDNILNECQGGGGGGGPGTTGATGPTGPTGPIGPTGPAPAGNPGDVLYLVSSGVAGATENIFVDTTNNRVGIGTTGPVANLHVVGNTYISDS